MSILRRLATNWLAISTGKHFIPVLSVLYVILKKYCCSIFLSVHVSNGIGVFRVAGHIGKRNY